MKTKNIKSSKNEFVRKIRNKNTVLLFVFFVLFRFSLISQTPGEWTWMHGDNTPNSAGVFGVQGVANPANKPPALYEPCEWKDNNGNFWLFGGYNSSGRHTALWRFNPAANQWTWMKGPSAVNQNGVYGIQGIPSIANYPGSRGFGAITWTDASGNLWLFGGSGWDAVGGQGFLNDLWKYDPTVQPYGEWTWMKGPSTGNDPGSYGAQGISIPANLPPSREETSCSWTDNTGNLWLYGGVGNRGDLWRYDIVTNNWTWMHGASTPNPPAVYGTQGLAAPANTPGGRQVYCSWTDLAGNLWLFGGISGGTGFLNDLWKYDPTIPPYGEWTWMKGFNTGNDPGNYGAKCVSTGTNVPPARMETRARVRDACGNFWNFGGAGGGGGSNYNDLWNYNVSTNDWTWVSGDNIANQATVYGAQNVSSPANKLGGRNGNVAWIDNNGSIWIFGGAGGGNYYNDLFRYVPDPACVPVSGGVLTVSSNTIICSGQSATLTASGGTSYSWSPGGQSTSSIVISPTISTAYTVTGTCSSPVTVIVTVTPAFTVSQTISICPGKTYTLPGGTVVNASGIYKDTLTSIGGCDSIITTTLTVTSVINASQSVSICPGKTYTLPGGTVVSASGIYKDTLTSVAGCDSIITTTLTVVSAFNTSQSVSICTGKTYTLPGGTVVSAGGIYKDTLTSIGGCDSIITITLTVTPVITASPTYTPAVCGNANGYASANAAGGTGAFTYLWNPGGQTMQTATGLSGGTTYTVTVTDANNCTQTASVSITASNGLNISSTPTNVLCNEGATGSATVTVSSGTSPYTYTWSNSQTTSAATGLLSGNYTVTVTDSSGCDSTQIVTITEPSALTIQTSVTPASCDSSTGIATVVSEGGTPAYTYTWNNGQTTPTASGLAKGTYTVTITDANGCTKSAAVTVTEIPCPCPDNLNLVVPNAFSPNNDGENDDFCLQGGIEDCIKNLTITIYDRWGEEVYKSTDKNFCWEGTYKENNLNTAVFVYYMEATMLDGKEIVRKGNISLIK